MKLSTTLIKIFLAGDIMTGRGIDQILHHPSSPRIYESYLKDARDYVTLAEKANGSIPRKAKGTYIWGDALKTFEVYKPHLKIINLETSITKVEDYQKRKGINYRMHPLNIDVLTTVGINICSLANNHVLDWKDPGLKETISTLKSAKILITGAGANLKEAMAPAIYELSSGRVLVFSIGHPSSGIPLDWRATSGNPGVFLLNNLNNKAINKLSTIIKSYKKADDLVILSIHWGSNWGYQISPHFQAFSHQTLDDAGVDLIFGHSSHHPRPIEIYKGKAIIYGAGDLINDYEGIGGHEEYRSDLSLMYFLYFDIHRKKLSKIEMIPMQMKNFKLNYVSAKDQLWLYQHLQQILLPFKTQIKMEKNKFLINL